jgi:hypothetical protein
MQMKGTSSGLYKDAQLYFLAPQDILITVDSTRIFLADNTTIASLDVATGSPVGCATTHILDSPP